MKLPIQNPGHRFLRKSYEAYSAPVGSIYPNQLPVRVRRNRGTPVGIVTRTSNITGRNRRTPMDIIATTGGVGVEDTCDTACCGQCTCCANHGNEACCGWCADNCIVHSPNDENGE